MGKSSPTPPPAPNPYQTAQAQTQSNINTANANAELNRVNQVTPWGSLTYTKGDPNSDGTDNWTSTVNLSPDQQKLLDSSNAISQSLANLGQSQLSNVTNALQSPVDFSKASGVTNSPLQYGVDQSGLPQYQTNVSQGALSGGVQNRGQIQSSIPAAGSISQSISNPDLNTNSVTGGNINSSVKDAGQIGNSIASAGPIQRGIDTTGTEDLTRGANYGRIQDQLNLSNVPGLVGGDQLSGAMTAAQKAAYDQQKAFLDPQYAQSQRELENQLAQKGVMENSDAWNNALSQFNRQKSFDYNNAYDSSFQRGLAAENQLYSQGLSSNQNAFNQNLQAGNFANSAQNQGFGQSMANAQLNNSVSGQLAAQRLAQMQAANQAQAQQYGQNANDAAFANQAQAQRYGQYSNDTQVANQAQQQKFAQDLAALQEQNQAKGQQFQQNLAAGQFGNQGQQQKFTQNLAGMQAANQAQQQDYAQQLANAQQNNQMQAQKFGQDYQNAGLNNTASNDMFNRGLINLQANNQAANQAFNQSTADRSRQLNEMVQQQQIPMNLLNALRSGSQVTAPTFGNTPQVNMAGTDIGGLINQNYANQMGAYNAQVSQNNALTGGLFGLGAAALGAPAGTFLPLMGQGTWGSDRNIKQAIQLENVRPDGLGVYSFEYKPEFKKTWGEGRFIGVMADEVERVYPHAVIQHQDGYKMVNYGAI